MSVSPGARPPGTLGVSLSACVLIRKTLSRPYPSSLSVEAPSPPPAAATVYQVYLRD